MRIRVLLLLTAIALAITSCQNGAIPTVFVMEVTREVPVTVVVTVLPTSGPLSLVSPTPTKTPEGTPVMTATPSVTPTNDPFPTPVIGQVFIADQPYENGRMFWIQPVDQIWVLTTENGKNVWQVFSDDFEDGMLEKDPSIVPPEGKYQPSRGFGKLWRENPKLREALGWAITEELGYNTRYEYHAGGEVNAQGTYVPASGYHVLENLTKEVFTFYEGAWTWDVKEPN